MPLPRKPVALLVVPTAALLWPASAAAQTHLAATDTRALTAVSCTISGSGTFANTADTTQGITDLASRDILETATASGSCLDLRTDKSATGGRTIVSRSVNVTGHLQNSTCVLATGHYTATATWTLDDSSTVSSSNTIDIAAGNFLESVPGSGAVDGGLFQGATVENNTVLPNALANTAACATTAGLKNYSFVTEVNVLQ